MKDKKKYIAYQKLLNEFKAVLRRKLTDLKVFLRKKRGLKINDLSFHLKKL